MYHVVLQPFLKNENVSLTSAIVLSCHALKDTHFILLPSLPEMDKLEIIYGCCLIYTVFDVTKRCVHFIKTKKQESLCELTASDLPQIHRRFIPSSRTHRAIYFINNLKQYDDAYKCLKSGMKVDVLGICCKETLRSADAVLELSNSDADFVFQLFNFEYIPTSLKNLLESEEILKVGDGIMATAQRLSLNGIQVKGTLDLRYVALYANCAVRSIEQMTKIYLNVSGTSDVKLKVDGFSLMNYQVDSFIGIDLFLYFMVKCQPQCFIDGYQYQFIAQLYRWKDKPFNVENILKVPIEASWLKVHLPLQPRQQQTVNERSISNAGNEKSSSSGNVVASTESVSRQPQQSAKEIIAPTLHLRFLSEDKCRITYIVKKLDECDYILDKIEAEVINFGVLGFDCEWKPNFNKKKPRNPIALIQLATLDFDVIFQLKSIECIPQKLKKILENGEIIKVGVEPNGDAEYLFDDYGIVTRSTLDLRYLAKSSGCEPGSLKIMSERYSEFPLVKKKKIICSDWELARLSEKQIQYAANDAFMGIDLFVTFFEKLIPVSHSNGTVEYIKHNALSVCQSRFDEFYDVKQKKNTKRQEALKNMVPKACPTNT